MRGQEKKLRWIVLAAALAAALAASGCSASGSMNTFSPPSVQALEYYVGQIKGYQHTYPGRRILILAAVDARTFDGISEHAPFEGNAATGVVIGRSEAVVQRLYTESLASIVQNAVVASAQEAGLTPVASAQADYRPQEQLRLADYVLAPRIAECWLTKRTSPEGSTGSRWSTTAKFALQVTIYKPPFTVPFWQGSVNSTYDDPPVANSGFGLQDETAIYDEPGQVLSVAMTQAVAAIWRRTDLHTLIVEDQIRPR